MPSALETIAANAIFITFPVSDGDPSRRPDCVEEPSPSAKEVNWHRMVEMDERYARRWRNLIGQGIAKLMNKPNPERFCIESFPYGYMMFEHNKGPISKIRQDLYLYGSKTALRFRSPAEFIPHGLWLLTDPTVATHNCGCKYCGGSGTKSQTQISETLGLPTNRGPTAVTGGAQSTWIGVPNPSRRLKAKNHLSAPPPLPTNSPWVPPAERQPIPINPAWQTRRLNLEIAASPLRISDLTSSRRFRIGELVWSRRNMESLMIWPAIILDFSVTPLSRRSAGYEDNHMSQPWCYTILFLGTDVNENSIEIEEAAIFPWHGLHEHMKVTLNENIGAVVKDGFDVAIRAANNLINSWALYHKLTMKLPATPLDPSTLPGDTDLLQEGFPHHSSAHMVRLGPTKRVKSPNPSLDIHEPQPSTSDSKMSPQERITKKNFKIQVQYEGIWYGAERLWLGDHVRLLPERNAFTESLRLTANTSSDLFWRQPNRITPSPGAENRGVLMRIDRIFVSDENADKECLVAGPLFEVADQCWRDDFANTNQPLNSSLIDPIIYPWELSSTPLPADKQRNEHVHAMRIEPLPPAPTGYVFRPLLPSGTELPLPLSFIAGRYYHDILKSGQPREIPHSSAHLALSSLCCLTSGQYNHATCTEIKLPDRASMVEEAVATARATLEAEGKSNNSRSIHYDEMDIDVISESELLV